MYKQQVLQMRPNTKVKKITISGKGKNPYGIEYSGRERDLYVVVDSETDEFLDGLFGSSSQAWSEFGKKLKKKDCNCDEPEDAGSSKPDVLHRCGNCGGIID